MRHTPPRNPTSTAERILVLTGSRRPLRLVRQSNAGLWPSSRPHSGHILRRTTTRWQGVALDRDDDHSVVANPDAGLPRRPGVECLRLRRPEIRLGNKPPSSRVGSDPRRSTISGFTPVHSDATAHPGSKLRPSEGERATAPWPSWRSRRRWRAEGELWTEPVQLTFARDEHCAAALGAALVGTSIRTSAKRARNDVLARHSEVPSPVTSYLAVEPGVRPSTEVSEPRRKFGEGIGQEIR